MIVTCGMTEPVPLNRAVWVLTGIIQVPEVFIGKALKGAAIVGLLQILDNETNGGVGEC